MVFLTVSRLDVARRLLVKLKPGICVHCRFVYLLWNLYNGDYGGSWNFFDRGIRGNRLLLCVSWSVFRLLIVCRGALLGRFLCYSYRSGLGLAADERLGFVRGGAVGVL